MSPLPGEVAALIESYLDEDSDEDALRSAAAWAKAHPIDLAVLFDWLHRYPASRERRSRAEVVLRAAVGLPLVAGPVCRPTPPG